MQGMGEGEGKKDVSDQIQDEDQLLGAQQKDQPPPESKVHHTPSQYPQHPSRPATPVTPSHVHTARFYCCPALPIMFWRIHDNKVHIGPCFCEPA